MHTKEVLKAELIGCKLEVINSKNPSLIGMAGMIIDETKNMFTLDNKKKLIKSQSVFKIGIKGKTYEIDGKILQTRPEDRIKK